MLLNFKLSSRQTQTDTDRDNSSAGRTDLWDRQQQEAEERADTHQQIIKVFVFCVCALYENEHTQQNVSSHLFLLFMKFGDPRTSSSSHRVSDDSSSN